MKKARRGLLGAIENVANRDHEDPSEYKDAYSNLNQSTLV
jgi:hypothetical protein